MKQMSQSRKPSPAPAISRGTVIDEADLEKVSGGGGARGGVIGNRAEK